MLKICFMMYKCHVVDFGAVLFGYCQLKMLILAKLNDD